MSRKLRIFPVAGVCAVFFLSMGTASITREKLKPGSEWLTWSPAEREVYVHGFMEGYWHGSQLACNLADDLFEVGKPFRLGQNPRARCQNHLEEFSKSNLSDSGTDFSAYTTVLTEFYTKHPEYQNIPEPYLFTFLSDRNNKTADQLYQMALAGKIDTNFP